MRHRQLARGTNAALPGSACDEMSAHPSSPTLTHHLERGTTKATPVLVLPSDKKNLYLGRAKRLYSAGKGSSVVMERVITYLNKAISYQPDPECYMLLAKAYLNAQDLTSSIYCLRYVYQWQMKNQSTDIPLTKKKLSEMFTFKGKEFMLATSCNNNINATMQLYTWADLMFQESARLNKSYSQNYVQRAICLVRRKEFPLALKNLIRAYACEDAKTLSYEVVIFRAKVYFAMGLQDEGNRDMRSIVDKLPNHIEVERFVSRTYLKTEKMYKLSLQAFAQGNYTESRRFIEFAFQITPDDIKLHVLLSKIHRMTGSLHDSYVSIQQAAAIYKAYSNNKNDLPDIIIKQTNLVLNLMALQLAGKADYDKAIILFTKVISSEKNLCNKQNNAKDNDVDYRYFLNRGDCFRALSNFDKAIADYNFALARNISNWDIRTRLSISYYSKATHMFNSCDYHDANISISYAIDHNPRVAHYFALRGKIRYYLGLFDEAFADFDRVKQLESSADLVADMLEQYDSSKSMIGDKENTITATTIRDRGINRVVPTRNDTVHALLNPKLAMRLPSLRLLHNTDDKTDSSKKLSRLPKKHTIFSLVGKEIEKNVSSILTSKFNPEKNDAWSIVSYASRSSKKLDDDAIDKKIKMRGGQTAAALKRLSLERTKHNLKSNPIIGGVVSRKGDPVLLSLTTKPSALGGIFAAKDSDVIKVARKWNDNEGQPVSSASGRARNSRGEKASEVKSGNNDVVLKKKSGGANKKDIDPEIAKRLNITLAHELSDSSDSENEMRSNRSSTSSSTRSSSKSRSDSGSDNEFNNDKCDKKKGVDSDADDVDIDNFEGGDEDEEESRLAVMLREAGVESTINFNDPFSTDSHLLLSLEDELKLLQKKIEIENHEKNIELSMELAHHED